MLGRPERRLRTGPPVSAGAKDNERREGEDCQRAGGEERSRGVAKERRVAVGQRLHQFLMEQRAA